MSALGQLQFHQALHGYDDGHRLIACSARLSLESRRTMAARSDLSGPLSDEPFVPYLTGYPLSEDPYYVLSRTWLATEMPRRGCVWTHSILIAVSDLGIIQSAAPVIDALRRPGKERRDYTKPLFLHVFESGLPATPRELLPWVNALYGSPKSTVWKATSDAQELENLFIAIWNQQWPRLRRTASFCTAYLGSPDSSWAKLVGVPMSFSSRWRRADVQRFLDVTSISAIDAEAWALLAAEDAADPGGFREFLWRHGAIEESSIELYRPLAEAYSLVCEADSAHSQAQLLANLRDWFPHKGQLPRLKLEFFGDVEKRAPGPGARTPELLLLQVLYSAPSLSHMPDLQLPVRTLNAWKAATDDERNALLGYLGNSRTARRDKRVLSTMAPVFDTPAVLRLGETSALYAAAFVARRPELAAGSDFWGKHSTRSIVAALLSEGCRDVDRRWLLRSAIQAAAPEIAEIMERMGRDDIREVATELLASGQLSFWTAPPDVKQAIQSARDTVRSLLGTLDPVPNGLLEAAATLLQPLEVKTPLTTWTRILASLAAFSSSDERTRCQVFLLALALHRSRDRPHAERIASATYGDVYASLADSRSASQLWDVIQPSLPSVPFFRDWDRCWRLKEAVTDAFLHGGWPASSLPEFATNPKAFHELASTMAKTRAGRRILKDARQSWPSEAPSWGKLELRRALD